MREAVAGLYRGWLSSGHRMEDSLAASALFFAPHPDDEVLGCGGTIARKVEAGASVGIVIMTDGRHSHGRLMDGDSMAALRAGEAIRAAARLGVPAEHVHWMGFEDRSLAAAGELAIARVREVLEIARPQAVFLPSEYERPKDHAMTNSLVRAALKASGTRATVYEYPVWFWMQWPFAPLYSHGRRRLARLAMSTLRDNVNLLGRFRYTLDVRRVLKKKAAALSEYRSQTTRLAGDDWPVLGDVADGAFSRCFEQEWEVFRRLSS
ncbi:MAG: PIG-L deacetylase family protein [Pseudomonadota bacterium]|nr:PIG-L deacetylase family protein [Pseudomonadota bacterium]